MNSFAADNDQKEQLLGSRSNSRNSTTASTASLQQMSSNGSDYQEYTWSQLQAIEVRRREILQRSGLPYWKMLSYVEGTCLKALSSHVLFWFTLAIYIGIRVQVRTGEESMSVPGGLQRVNIDVIGGFLSFFLVMYVNQANARFSDMYKESRNMCKRILDIAANVSTAFPPAHAQRMVRYLNAAHVLGYVGLGQAYSQRHFFDTVNQKYQMLTPDELELLRSTTKFDSDDTPTAIDLDNGPEACHYVVEWCMKDVDSAYEDKLIEVKDFINLREKILAFRNSMDTLYDYNDQPIHFFYIHFLVLLSTMYLPLFAASHAYKAGTVTDELHWSADILSGIIVMVQSIFVIGLRMLGRRLVDPYGDDIEDLSVLTYVQTTWQRSQMILRAKFPDKVQPQTEDLLKASRQ